MIWLFLFFRFSNERKNHLIDWLLSSCYSMVYAENRFRQTMDMNNCLWNMTCEVARSVNLLLFIQKQKIDFFLLLLVAVDFSLHNIQWFVVSQSQTTNDTMTKCTIITVSWQQDYLGTIIVGWTSSSASASMNHRTRITNNRIEASAICRLILIAVIAWMNVTWLRCVRAYCVANAMSRIRAEKCVHFCAEINRFLNHRHRRLLCTECECCIGYVIERATTIMPFDNLKTIRKVFVARATSTRMSSVCFCSGFFVFCSSHFQREREKDQVDIGIFAHAVS